MRERQAADLVASLAGGWIGLRRAPKTLGNALFLVRQMLCDSLRGVPCKEPQ
jgi:hypothetical protein